ncbi:hypothetical protein AN219_37845 [Streptomyces nanshensis]|nr:hypothetical protein AN219_37845 [Streptomyces nanshensis]
MLRRIRERRETDRIYDEQMQKALLMHERYAGSGSSATSEPARAQPPLVEGEFLPKELRAPTREELTGLMMRHDEPLVIQDEVRACPQCGAYRMWVVFIMGEHVWLRCPAGHDTHEPRLDAAWYNRNSGPLTGVHASIEDGLKALGL